MNYNFIASTAVFKGISEAEIPRLLQLLQCRIGEYVKGETIYRRGDTVTAMGLVLTGGVYVESGDAWGQRSIFAHIAPGAVFAETYACLSHERLQVSVVAAEEATVLFIDLRKILTAYPADDAIQRRLTSNLFDIMAAKNLHLTGKINHITPRTIRGRLLAYLSSQAVKYGQREFIIPFNRQQLADYLCVERSALSKELGKMQNDGLLAVDRSHFNLFSNVAIDE